MNTIEGGIESMVQILQRLDGAPAIALIFVSCLVLGYVLKGVRQFPNSAIPTAVILWGAIVNPVIADAMNDTPLRIWMIRNVLVGAITGFAAWMAHMSILSRIEDKLGLFTKPKPTTTNETPTNPVGPDPRPGN